MEQVGSIKIQDSVVIAGEGKRGYKEDKWWWKKIKKKKNPNKFKHTQKNKNPRVQNDFYKKSEKNNFSFFEEAIKTTP